MIPMEQTPENIAAENIASTNSHAAIIAGARFAAGSSRLQVSGERIARRFPLPQEAVDQVSPDDTLALIRLVNQCKSNAEVIQLGKQLPQRGLTLIFPILTDSDLPAHELTPKTLDRLFLILRERACRSLYNKGWVVWQRHFPHPVATKALAVICGILEIKQAGSLSVQTSPRKPTGRIPLVTELVELSGHTICRKLIARLDSLQLSLNLFFSKYAVEKGSSFYRSLLGEAFTSGSAAMFSEQIDQLDDIFSATDIEAKARIMRHFLSLEPLKEEVRQQAHVAFYRAVGAPGGSSAVWAALSDKEKRAFNVWVSRARIGSHCLDRPDKARFYLRYAEAIRRVEPWDSETLLLYFKDFVIADDSRYPDQALLYPGTVPSPHPSGLADPDRALSPGNPAIAHRRIEESLRQGQITGIVQLQFDPEGLKQSGALIDFALQNRSPQGLFAPLRNRGHQLT